MFSFFAEVAEGLFRPLATGALWLLRALLWLAWDLALSIVGWGIGWCVCRVLTFGRYPGVGIGEEAHCEFLPRLAVELLGLATLFGLVWWLSGVLKV